MYTIISVRYLQLLVSVCIICSSEGLQVLIIDVFFTQDHGTILYRKHTNRKNTQKKDTLETFLCIQIQDDYSAA